MFSVQYGPALQRLQMRAAQLVMQCCRAVDEKAGTQFAAMEQETTARSGTYLRKLLSDGVPLQTAALKTALQAWEQRQQEHLPRLSHCVCAARVVLASTNIGTQHSSGSGATEGSKDRSVLTSLAAMPSQLPLAALHREVACSALGCANPLCAGGGDDRSLLLSMCRGCRAVRYCR